MRSLKLTLEYDGTRYVGWQRQAEGVSIQGLLEEALTPFEGGPVTVHGAGRTDAGVHALGQVASVAIRAGHDALTLQRALNAVLPDDVRVVRIEDVPAGFHARFDAVSKTYEYRIVNAPFVSAFEHQYVWHVTGRLNIDAMRAGAALLEGTHDFAAFQSAGGDPGGSTVRTISAIRIGRGQIWNSDISRGPENVGKSDLTPGSIPENVGKPDLTPSSIRIRVTGNGFLRHMVRAIVGTLVEVGLGRWTASHVQGILDGRDRRNAGRAAPASGLFLVEVTY